MKITYSTPRPTHFKDLAAGEWFTEDGDLYIKCGESDGISLDGGTPAQYAGFNPDAEVFKVAEVLITLEN